MIQTKTGSLGKNSMNITLRNNSNLVRIPTKIIDDEKDITNRICVGQCDGNGQL
jgi:hypothetical protein